MERRALLNGVAAAAAAAAAALLFLPAAAYVLSPLRRRDEEAGWIDLGPLAAFPDATPALAPYAVEADDGWQRRARPASAWVTRRGAEAQVFTSACPHLGCAVRYDRGAGAFACPCHASAFAADGRRLSGPARRGLDPLPHRVEGGRLLIRHVHFRPAAPERIPVDA
jgi:menaquinol-cytochrome c reductase iron-sulfur subunit